MVATSKEADIQPDLLTLNDVAARLSVSLGTAKKLVYSHQIKSNTIGKLRRVHVDDLAEFETRWRAGELE